MVGKFLLLVIAVLVVTVLALFLPHALRFEQHRDEMRALLSSANPSDRHLGQPLRGLLEVSLRGHPEHEASRLLIFHFGREEAGQGNMAWHLASATWAMMIWLHFSPEDRLALVAVLAPTGPERHGLFATSMEMFGRPPEQLSLEEAATLIVLVEGWGWNSRPDRLAGSRDRLLKRYQQAQGEK